MIEPVIYLCDLKNVHVITIKEIVLIKAQRSYCSIFLQDGEAITYTKSLSCIGKVLKGNKFLRIGQSHIINRNQIRKIDKVNKLIKLIRRITGGGAVYHDLNNLNFSFVTKVKGLAEIDFKSYYQPIVNALRNIGIDAELSGRNDVTIDDKKCIGASQSIWKGRVLSNGCILYDVQLTELSKALNPDPSKLKLKGVDSVRTRVTNVKPYLEKDIDVLEFKDILLKEIFKLRGEEPKEYKLSEEELAGVKRLYDVRWSRAAWNWGRIVGAKHYIKHRFPSGSVELSFDLTPDNRFLGLKIFGDFFGIKDVSLIEERLEGIARERDTIQKAIADLNLPEYLGKSVDTDAFVELFFKED